MTNPVDQPHALANLLDLALAIENPAAVSEALVRALRASEDRGDGPVQGILRAAVDRAPLGVLVTDDRGRVAYANPGFQAYTGYSREDLEGRDPAFLATSPEEVPPWLPADPTDPAPYWSGDRLIRKRDGTVIREGLTLLPVRDAQGRLAHLVWIGRDLSTRDRREERDDGQVTVERLDKVLRQTVTALSKAMVHTDLYTAGHAFRVADLCGVLGARLGLDAERLIGLDLAAKAHDIGQIKVPAEILLRSGALTPLEFEFVKQHVAIGWEILREIDFPWAVAEIVLQHHENVDGSGYPRGLRGDALLPEARVLRVADTAESLSSHRPFRAAHDTATVIGHLRAMRGSALDPDITDLCVALLEDGYRFPPPPDASPSKPAGAP
jgi:PAS domain S-box-containing protein